MQPLVYGVALDAKGFGYLLGLVAVKAHLHETPVIRGEACKKVVDALADGGGATVQMVEDGTGVP